MNKALAVFTGEESNVVGKVPVDNAEKVALVNAMSDSTARLSDCINMELQICNYFVERVNITDSETGETRPAIRVVLIDPEGKSYSSLSSGVATSLKNLIAVFGSPDDWSAPIRVVVKQVQVGRGRMLTLVMQ